MIMIISIMIHATAVPSAKINSSMIATDNDNLNEVPTQPLCISGFLEQGLLFSSPPANTCNQNAMVMVMTTMMTC